eukprot:s2451_g8.t1
MEESSVSAGQNGSFDCRRAFFPIAKHTLAPVDIVFPSKFQSFFASSEFLSCALDEEPPQDQQSDENVQVHKITLAEGEQLDPRFPLVAKLIGKGGRNVKHISSTTGANVWLRGRGSGSKGENAGEDSDEPLHIAIRSDDKDRLLALC